MHYFKQIVMVDAFLLPFATHHRFISFVLYVIGEFFKPFREKVMI
jgi:phosphatidate cytidylyltransferase